ncbi:sigma factor-like helix-turn-helix DNA-binding protein, partial [Klebsiella pneumoniae]|uniref:sigma factor-like helix-turn-helix DNA-binding protein n=1 Tax=Klebsiella pneumoniae TaxID=573 RepID=UPI003B5A5C13
DFRMAITLRELVGLCYVVIAAILECPVGSVSSRIFRTRVGFDYFVIPLFRR